MPPLENPPAPKSIDEPESSPFGTPLDSRPPSPAAPPVENAGTNDSTVSNDNTKSKSSVFDLPNLYNSFKDTVTGAASEIPSMFAPAGDLLPGKDGDGKKAPDAISKASEGSRHADSHEASYLGMLHRGENKRLAQGDYKKDDGSSYRVDANGKITEFTTAPTKDSPAKSYKNIAYDKNGEMMSYVSPTGHQFSRLPQTDRDGFGTWSVKDAKGVPVMYAGANAYCWRGKSVVDDGGFHSMVGGGKNSGAMYTRASDGTSIESSFALRDQHGLILQTKVSLPDSTEVTRNARLVSKDTYATDAAGRSRLQHNDKLVINSQVKVVDAKETETTRVKLDASGDKGEIVDTTKIGLKVSPEAQRVADKVLKKITDSPNPVKELTANFKNLENLKTFSMTKRQDGKQDIDINFHRATTQPAINANVNGYTPGPSRIDSHLSFTLSHTAQGVNLDNIQGITGSVSKRKTLPTWTNSMHFRQDQNGRGVVDVGSTALGPMGRRYHSSTNTFGAQNFHAGTPMRDLVAQPEVLKNMAGAIRMFQSTDDLQKVSLKNTGPQSFEVATHGSDSKHIPVNHNLEKQGMMINSIDLDKNLSASLKADATGTRLTNMKGLSLKVTTVLGESIVTPREVALETNKEGVPVVSMKLEHPQMKGEYLPFEIPVARLQELRNQKR